MFYIKLQELYKIFLFCIFLTSLIYAQEELADGELRINFENRPTTWNIDVKFLAFGSVWNQFHLLTNDFHGGNKSYNQNSLKHYHVSDLDWSDDTFTPILSLGLYEVSIWEGNNKCAWFFLDYRTSHLPYATTFGLIDISFEYDLINHSFEFINPNLGTINNGDYFSIWEIHSTIDLQTDDLQNYWSNALTIIPQYDLYDEYYEPLLIWGPYNNFVPAGYKIYWRYNSTGSFHLLQTVSSNTYQYLHESVPIGKGGSLMEYKVQAYNNQIVSDFTNIASINSSELFMDKKLVNGSIRQLEFYLYKNYPNPFNPNTIIRWQSPISGYTILKVYDLLGREAALLVNEYKESGNHSIEFDGKDLSSGVYIFRIQVDNYSKAQKMILQK